VPDVRAALAANMETAVNALWDAPPRPGDRVLVIGAGLVGLIVATLAAQTAGARVCVVELEPTRAALARELGFTTASPDAPPKGMDLVFHASGNSQGLVTALAAAGTEATIIELSWYGERPVTLPLGEAFHSQRLSIISSQVGRVAPVQMARWTRARRLALALELLSDACYDRLIGPRVQFAELGEAMKRLASSAPTPPAVIVEYDVEGRHV
jgi:threonine dehydrogenase-like Zn-dependent dehydrogenase